MSPEFDWVGARANVGRAAGSAIFSSNALVPLYSVSGSGTCLNLALWALRDNLSKSSLLRDLRIVLFVSMFWDLLDIHYGTFIFFVLFPLFVRGRRVEIYTFCSRW